MAISDAFLQELRDRVEIEAVITPYVNLRRRGRLMTGLCPFHNEKTPSFTVYLENQSFYCFGCGAGGDAISFLRRIENLDYVEAVKQLAQQAGMRMPEDGVDDTLMKRRAQLLEANREAARFFHGNLHTKAGSAALQYLLGRDLMPQTIQHFGLGFALDDWSSLRDHMRQKGFSDQVLLDANLLRKSSKEGSNHVYDNFRNRIMFPIIDLRGNVIAFGGRVMDDGVPKYINTSDTMVYKKSNGVFALNFAKNANQGRLIVAEGYMDVIALHQAGFTNAIACLGTALTREQANLLSRYAQEVILAYDSDNAGQQAANRAISIFHTTDLEVRVLQLRGGKDPDEIIRKHGKERFQQLLDGAANDIEYRLLREREKFDLETDDGKLHFLKAAANILAELSGDIERDVYCTRLATELQVSKEALQREAEVRRKQLRYKREKDRNRQMQRDLLQYSSKTALQNKKMENNRSLSAQELLLTSLLRNPDFYTKIASEIQAEAFSTPLYSRLFREIGDRVAEGREISPTFLAQSFTPQEMDIVMRLFLQGRKIQNSLQECRDCIQVIHAERDRVLPENVAELNDEEYLRLFEKKSK